MADATSNIAVSQIASGSVIGSNSGTSLVVSAGDGAKFPVAPFNIVVWPSGVQPTTANCEFMRVTAKSTDTFTVTRNAETGGSLLSIISAGYQVQHGVTKKTLDDLAGQRVATSTIAPSGSLGDYIGNGTTDDVAINNALTATAGLRIIRAGTYQVTQNLLPQTGSVVSGEGYGTQLILAIGKVIKVDQQNNVVIRDLYLDPSANTSTNSYAIYIDRSSDVTVKDVFINQTFAYGIFVTNQTAGTTVSRFRFLNNRVVGKCNNDLIGGGPGSTTSNVTDLLIQGNFLMQDATLTGAGTYINAIDVVAQQKSTIINNVTYGGILLGGEKIPHLNVDVIGNIVNPPNGISSSLAVGQIALLCNNSGQSADSSSINIIGNQITTGNIFVQGQTVTSNRTRKVVIANNNIGGTKVATWTDHNYGINLQYLADVKVEGNVVDGSTRGVYINDVQNIDISNNTFLNCTTPIVFGATASTNVTGHNNFGINPDTEYSAGNITGAVTFDRVNGIHQTATLTGNITVTIPSTYFNGELLTLELTQDGTGSRTVTWPANFKKAGGSLALSTAAGATDIINMRWDGTNWVEVSRALNVS